jgi:hypothetical protein
MEEICRSIDARDAEQLTGYCAWPFLLQDKIYANAEELHSALAEFLRQLPEGEWSNSHQHILRASQTVLRLRVADVELTLLLRQLAGRWKVLSLSRQAAA